MSTQRFLLDWIKRRGVLYALTQTPILALLVGFFLRLAPYSVMIFGVFLAFVALPLWIVHRKTVSDDPSEPVHHLTKYALWALVPVPLFSLVRIPTHYLFGMAYWHPWYDFGSSLTGLPINQFSSLIPGAFLYSLQGYSLTLGFYILFQKHSLLNAILYICIFDTSIYSFIFPAFARVGMPSPPRWHAVAWIAHLCMSSAVWFSPRFWQNSWPCLKIPQRIATILVIALIVIVPYAFPFYRAAVWQFPTQHRIDQNLFNQSNLIKLHHSPVFKSSEREASYEFSLEFGPRTFKNYVGRQKALDAKNVEISARIIKQGKTIGWCHSTFLELPSANQFTEDEKRYFTKLRELDVVPLLVNCFGPKKKSSEPVYKLEVEWEARLTLVGDREEAVKTFSSRQKTVAMYYKKKEIHYENTNQ